jgi:tetratricopeptide (TPR) repeat protein
MAMLNMATGQQEEAVESAVAAAEEAPNDYTIQMWCGNVLLRHGKYAEAEKYFVKARDLAENVADTWLALVNFYATTQNMDAAQKTIAAAESKIPAEQKDRVLASAYDLAKDVAKAGPFYEAALKQTPDDLNLLRQYAQFQNKAGNPQKTVDTLTAILEKAKDAGPEAEPAARWARRTLTQIVGAGNEFANLRQAVAIMDGSVKQFPLDLNDQSLKADILSKLRDGAARTEAIRLLSDNVAKAPDRVEDQVGLARLYNRAGDWTSAKGSMLTALKLQPNEGRWMLVYAEMLLQHDELLDAAAMLDKYEKEITPKAPLYTSLRAQLLALQDQPEQSIAMAKTLVTPPLAPDQIPQLKSVAAMLEAFARKASNPEPYYEAAGALYREYVKEVPDDMLVLAAFTGLHDNLDESLQLYEDAIAKGTPSKDAVLRMALTTARARVKDITDAQKERIHGWLDAAIKEKPDDPGLPVLLADFYDLQGKFDESEKIYRGLISNEKLSGVLRATVLNNLAYLIAAKDNQGKEALPFIDEAIKIVGPIPEFLDTRAMAHLSAGNTKEAVEDLKLSLAESASDIKMFHLAIALLKSEDEAGAADAFKKAIELGLKPDSLSSLERPHYDTLTAKFPTEVTSIQSP